MTPATAGTVQANGIEIAYETFGDPADPTVLLVMGLGVQLLGWDEGFCAMVAERGFQVVRFDNRDVGLTTHLHGAPPPDIVAVFSGDTSSASYALEDMADDAAGLLDALGIDAAHVVGVSMGGMIVQTLALRHPQRVRSLVSIMSTPAPAIGPATPAALKALLTPPPADLEGNVERAVDTWRVIGSPGFPFDEAAVRERARASYQRAFDPLGVGRQLAAIHKSGDRSAALAGVTAPALVVHGVDDPLITVEGGKATAAAIPGAELELVQGMGHDLPRDLWPRLVDGIARTAERAGATPRPA